MITTRFKTGTEYAGQNIKFLTELFGKAYFWMTDVDETWYLVPVSEDGLPDFS
jgi:hypothetical protein